MPPGDLLPIPRRCSWRPSRRGSPESGDHRDKPRGKRGPQPVIVAAAQIAGIDRIFKVGGAQAVAAMAYGTESVPAVDKIVGPGNAWVATAKKLVFGRTGIDMIAGPSEILVIADESPTLPSRRPTSLPGRA